MHSSDPVLSETAKADSVHPAAPQTSGPSGGHRGDAAPNVPGAGGSVTDSQRLDWLDARNKRFRMGWKVGMAPAGNVSVQPVIQLGGSVTSIRDAIDAAMQEAAK